MLTSQTRLLSLTHSLTLTSIPNPYSRLAQELYEPLWDEFYLEAKRLGIRIRSIYIADAAWQGRSGILNEGKLGNDRSSPPTLPFMRPQKNLKL